MHGISKNIAASLLLQIITIINGLIVPRLILQTFGSNINGLVSSITQFSNYITLLEGGVASVMMANLYKPLYEKNLLKISSVFAAMNKFFKGISIIIFVYQISLAILYPFFVNSGLDWDFVASLVLILGITNFIQYNFSYSLKLLLEADNKIYITKAIQAICVVFNTIVTYVTIKIWPEIHVVKLLSSCVFSLQPIVFNHYLKKTYRLDKSVSPDENALSQRWDGFAINMAAFVHNNTDIVVLTSLSNLIAVSIYNINMMVVNGVRSIVISILVSFVPTLGKYIASENKEKLIKYFRRYELISFFLSSTFFTIAACLINQFIRLYTTGISDANYYQPVFAVTMLFAEWCYCVREPYVELAYQSNKFKDISKYAYLEAILNVIISVVLVRCYGLIGVAIGTGVAIVVRTLLQVIYVETMIKGTFKNFILHFISMLIAGIANYYLINMLKISNSNNMIEFTILTFVTLILSTAIFICLILFIDRKTIIEVLEMLKRK